MSASIVVQKYGGSSVSTPDKLRTVAELVVKRRREGHGVVVVISAMGDTTDELLELAKKMSPEPDRRELDMLLTAGERISMSLLAMAIREQGEAAVSLTGSQSGIITTASHSKARIMEVRPFRVQDELERGHIVIVAGFQGVSYRRDVTTLGRGGSDTTAVALAAALDAEACEIYSDVDGVFTADPRVVEDAARIDALGYQEMQELAEHGAKVLNAQAIEFAKQKNIAIYARKTGVERPGSVVRKDVPTAPSGVRAIAHERQVIWVHTPPTEAADQERLLEELSGLGCAPRQLSLERSAGETKLSFVLALSDLHNGPSARLLVETAGGPGSWRDDVGTISLIGEGITADLGLVNRILKKLRDERVRVVSLSTSSFRISLVVKADAVEDTVRRLHDDLGLAHPVVDAQLG